MDKVWPLKRQRLAAQWEDVANLPIVSHCFADEIKGMKFATISAPDKGSRLWISALPTTKAPSLPRTRAAADSRFADVLEAAVSQGSAPSRLLTTAELSVAHRPDIKTFMDSSGAGFEDAAELIYGVIGSNTDTRDWQSIMASDDPVAAARKATGQMYGDPLRPVREDAVYLVEADTLACSGRFGLRLLKDDDGKMVDGGLKLVDAHGLLLRDGGGNAEAIRRNAWLFGFDLADAASLVERAGDISPGLEAQLREAIEAVRTQTAELAPQGALPAAGNEPAAAPAGESAPASGAAALAQAQEDGAAAWYAHEQVAAGPVGEASPTSPFIDTASVLHSLLNVIEEDAAES